MFGDIGHGGLMFLFGLILMFRNEAIAKDPDSFLKVFLPFRYLISMMGFFAFYSGFIYNDFVSVNLNLFGSCFEFSEDPNS
jgi:V-type H+-transporting ATPase subunit a